LSETIKVANPRPTVWVSDPTWANHEPILTAVGLEVRRYRYLNRETRMVDFDGMHEDLVGVPSGDVVLLHGCCHNPSGADLEEGHWAAIAALAQARGFVPLIDVAYQGFGDGLDADAAPLRLMAGQVPEFMVAVSCSKNFGVYRDRVGCAIAVGRTSAQAEIARATLLSAGRVTYSFPPDHGAAVVATILLDPRLRAEWTAELDGMRTRILENREALAQALRLRSNGTRFDCVERHRGMFSLVPLLPEQIASLRTADGIYIPNDGRINIAGLRDEDIEVVATAIASLR